MGQRRFTEDKLAVMDGGKCILQLRGVKPFLSDKFDLTEHPNYHLTDDLDSENAFDVGEFLAHRAMIKAQDEFEIVDAG